MTSGCVFALNVVTHDLAGDPEIGYLFRDRLKRFVETIAVIKREIFGWAAGAGLQHILGRLIVDFERQGIDNDVCGLGIGADLRSTRIHGRPQRAARIGG